MAELNGNETLIQKITDGKTKIRELSLTNETAFNAALGALHRKPILAKELNPKSEGEKRLIIAWLNSKRPENTTSAPPFDACFGAPEKIVYLNEEKIFSDEQHDNDIIREYLDIVLKKSNELNDFHLFRSFGKNLVMKFNFETKKGEEIVYLDKELDLPIYMLAKAELLFKIFDPYAFVKFVDVHLQQINLELILSKIAPLIALCLRSVILKTIEEKTVSYYDLSKYYDNIAKDLRAELQAALESSGIRVEEAFLKNTCFANNVNHIFESQKVEFIQKQRDLYLQHKAERLSLENYERKAEIHSKYPTYEVGLTEKEKDNAIERYLFKERGYKEETVQAVKEKAIGERNIDIGDIRDTTVAKNAFAEKRRLPGEWGGILVSLLLLVIGCATIGVGVGAFLACASFLIGGLCVARLVHKKDLSAVLSEEESEDCLYVNETLNENGMKGE